MVADTIVYHPSITKLISFLDNSAKREKCFRLVAYLSRFISYYLARKGYSSDIVNMFKELKSQVTFLRKGLRFLKPLNHLQVASRTYDNKLMDPVLQLSTVIRNLGYAGYLSLDSIVWFKMLGLVGAKRFQSIPKWASRFWLLGLIAGVVNSFRILAINHAKMNSVEEKQDIEATYKKLFVAKRKLVWDFLDIFICLNTLDILHFTEGDIGLAGTITSIMGLKDLWTAT